MEQQSNNRSMQELSNSTNEVNNELSNSINEVNYKLSFDINHIMNDLLNGIKPTSLSFEQFLELIDNESNNTICWKTEVLPSGKTLFLFSTEWNSVNSIESQTFSTKFFNNLVMDNQFNVLMYGGSKIFDSNRDKFNLDKIKSFYNIDHNSDFERIYEAYEGTGINVFYESDSDKWFYSTKKKFRMSESYFGSTKSHGSMFEDIISCADLESKLNKDYSYHFILIHNANSHLIKDLSDNNKLVLIGVRDRNRGHMQKNLSDMISEINEILTLEHISLPKEVSVEDFEQWNQQNDIVSQGIILHYAENVFRIYTNAYGQKLKANPKFHTDYEKLFWSFQNNELGSITDENTYNLTISAINYVAIMLFRTVLHFTKYKKDFTEDEKFSHARYSFIAKNNDQYEKLQFHNALKRNIYKLQRLPFAVKNLNGVDFNQVKHHIKYHCSAQDIYSMYQTFMKNPQFETMVNYKCSLSQRVNINNFLNVKLNA